MMRYTLAITSRGGDMPQYLRTLMLILVAAAMPALAHHGISNWDLNTDLTITGRVTRIQFISPHAWLHLEVKGANGKSEPWQCEMRSAHSLRRSGWTVDMFRVGSTITVTGSPERYKPRQCYLSTIEFEDRSRMDRYGQRQLPAAQQAKVAAVRAMRTADGRPNFAGDWAAEQRVMTDPRGQNGTLVTLSQAATLKPGELPAGQRAFPGARGTPESLASDPIRAAWNRPIPVRLTVTGRQALEKFDPASTDNPRLRCEPTGILFDWTFDSVVNRIVQTPTRITLQYGHMDLTRVIHLDNAARPGVKPSRAGYSSGRWEGNVLVVETTRFLPGVLAADARVLHGTKLRVTERFELDATGRKLMRRYEAVDPEYFEDVWRGEDVVMPSDIAFAPYRCSDPGGAPSVNRAAR
jgi:Family of unknown function (DUF6152)